MADLELLSQEHKAEWHRALNYLLLLILHRRDAEERDVLYGVVRNGVSGLHREEVEQMVYSSAQAYLDEGRAKGRAEGIAEGIEKGIEKGRAETLLDLLECKFGPQTERITSAIRAFPPERLQELTRHIMFAQSLDDLHLE